MIQGYSQPQHTGGVPLTNLTHTVFFTASKRERQRSTNAVMLRATRAGTAIYMSSQGLFTPFYIMGNPPALFTPYIAQTFDGRTQKCEDGCSQTGTAVCDRGVLVRTGRLCQQRFGLRSAPVLYHTTTYTTIGEVDDVGKCQARLSYIYLKHLY